MSKRDSFYDPLNPRIDPAKVRPYYEDRVLVKWTPPPADGSALTRVNPSPRDKGPHYGVVIAVGPGNSGLHLKPKGREIDPHTGLPLQRFKRFKGNAYAETPTVAHRCHAGCTVRPGDRVYYERTPQNEFEDMAGRLTFASSRSNQYWR